MFAIRRTLVASATVLALAGAGAILPAASGSAAQAGKAPALAYNVNFDSAEPTLAASSVPATSFAASTASAPSGASATDTPTPAVTTAPALASATQVDSRELECMAKVVHHESRGQPRRGQLAVAQALVNRLRAGRFGDSICAVASQRGQFFNVASYHPRQDTADWDMAEGVARDALAGETEQVAPGALFFRAAYAAPNSFFRSRERVAAVGGNVFYR